MQEESRNKTMENSPPPPNDLDAIIPENLGRHRTDSGYLDTSYNSEDSLSSPPQLTALIPSEQFADSPPPDKDAGNPNVEEELELPFPPVSLNEDETPPASSASKNEEPASSSSTFQMATVDGLVILSFSSQNGDANILASDGNDSIGDCVDHPPAEEKDFAFEAACSSLIKDLERLAKQPARKMKREHSQITTVSKASRLPRAGSEVPKSRAAVLEYPSSSFQTKSSSLKVEQQVKIISFDFVKDLKRRKKWKKSYLTGRFRVDEATGEIEPVIESRCKNRGCIKDRQSLLRKKAVLERNLAKHEKCIDGLARQHT